jgi:hypothetical protein
MHSVNKAPINRGFLALFLIGLWLAGCAELAYQHMNDPSRDTWQKPKEVIEKLAFEPGYVWPT